MSNRANAVEPVADFVEAVAASTGVFRAADHDGADRRPPDPPARRDILTQALVALVFLLLGGGATTTLSGLLDGDGAEALAQVAKLEARVESLVADVAGTAKKVEAVETSSQRMLRQQGRVLQWLVENSQRQSAALAAVARSAGVEVDLVAPPLLPEVEQ